MVELNVMVVQPDGDYGLVGVTTGVLSGDRTAEYHFPTSFEESPRTMANLKGFAPGQSASSQRTFSAQDLEEYSDLTGHDVDDIPGGLLGGMFSYLLGTELPGRGTNYLKQQLRYPMLAYPGQELTASVEINRIRPDKQLVNLDTLITNALDETICFGEALVLISDVSP